MVAGTVIAPQLILSGAGRRLVGMAFPVALREVTDDDLPLLYEHQADPGAAAMVGLPSRDRPAFDAHWAKIRVNPEGIVRTVVVGDEVAGHAVCFTRDGRREVGYWLDRAWWGKGVATEALAQLIALEPHRPLYGYLLKTNAGSRRVLEKNGFVYSAEDDEGLLLVLNEADGAGNGRAS